jgi:hypothetical protein
MLTCVTLKGTAPCVNCGATLWDWGYRCNVCGATACYRCYHNDRALNAAHEHPQPTPSVVAAPDQSQPVLATIQSQPARVQHATVVDRRLTTEPALASSHAVLAANCGGPAESPAIKPSSDDKDRCPSCAWTREATSTDSKLTLLESLARETKTAATWYDFNQKSAAGKSSHCIVSQSLLRTTTRGFLSKWKDRSPCDLLADTDWPAIAAAYKKALAGAASAPLPDDVPAEMAKTKRHGKPEANSQEVAALQARWKEQQKALQQGPIPIPDDMVGSYTVSDLIQRYTADGSLAKFIFLNAVTNGVPATLNGEQLTRETVYVPKKGLGDKDTERPLTAADFPKDVATLVFHDGKETVTLTFRIERKDTSPKQLKAKLDFISKFPRERREGFPTRVEQAGENIKVTVRVNGADPESYNLYKREIDRQGKTVSDKVTKVVEGVAQPETDATDAVQRIEQAWNDTVFNNLMRDTLTEGTQCDYCERLQRDYSLPQRYQYWKDHSGTAPEFVSLSLIEKVEAAGGPDKYLDKWLDGVVAELKVDLTRLCEEDKKRRAEAAAAASAVGPSGQKAAAKPAAKKEKEPEASTGEMDAAIDAAIKEAADQFTSLELTIAAGRKVSALGRTQVNKYMKDKIKEKLDAMVLAGKLTAGAPTKGNIPYERTKTDGAT